MNALAGINAANQFVYWLGLWAIAYALYQRLRGSPPFFQSTTSIVGGLMFAIALGAHAGWWFFRWLIDAAGYPDVAKWFVDNSHMTHPLAVVAHIGMALMLAELVRPVFGRRSMLMGFVFVAVTWIAGIAATFR
jgi:hypothetical protein